MSAAPRKPPRWADQFLQWYCRPELLEEIQGDAYELFDKRSRRQGAAVARRRFVWDVLRSFRLSTIRTFHLNLSPVFSKNNFKIAFRQLRKQKMYSAIKVGGFAVGIAACLLIAIFIRDELSYDRQWANVDRLYRVVGQFDDNGDIRKGVSFPAPFAAAVKDEFPEVEMIGRLNPNSLFSGAGSNQIRSTETLDNTYEEGFTYADQAFLDLFQMPMVYGSREHALDEPFTMVISRSKAEKFFPGENPVGKTMILNDDEKMVYKIGGVMEDFPTNSHFKYNFLLTLTGKEFWPGEQQTWMANNYHDYALLRPGTDPQALAKKFKVIITKYLIPILQKEGSQEIDRIEKGGSFILEPVADIHLRSYDVEDRLDKGDIRFIWLFGAVAVFILLIACVNFINLSTAKSANRALEVGLRKVVGSVKGHLVGQFLAESILYSLLSFLLGLLLAWVLLPYFNQLADKSLVFPWREWWLSPLLAGSALTVGVLAGLYPAFYLSSFRPIQVLKGDLSRGSRGGKLRSALVVFQFTTSIMLIIGTIVIHRQMNYILNKKLGFDKNQVMILQGVNTLGDQVFTLKKELLNLPEVEHVSVSDYLPISGTKRNSNSIYKEGRNREDAPVYAQVWKVDHDYLETMGMKMAEGRFFQEEMRTDSQALVVNQKLVKEFGLENPIGQRLSNGGDAYPIIGVVEDFHFESMTEDIGPLVMYISNSPSVISVKINTANTQAAVQDIAAVWKSFAPHQPIRYSFLDERFAMMYENVSRAGRIFSSFAVFAIFVACLGLFALSAFMAEQRSKEMGIRKVLGAPVQSIFRMLTQNFLVLVLISLVIAAPAAWYLMKKWLEDFAYQADIGWSIIALAGLLAVAIALLTVSYQAIRTAVTNPVEALRNE